jgi:hypothetical protein
MMLATVIKTGAGMVLAFDESGRELPEFQGHYHAVGDRLRASAGHTTVFKHWFGTAPAPVVVGPDEW